MTTDKAALEAADGVARARALDVRASFLVQAPAGSGKTGLLIARVLALLAVVERPEAILAMTFTRKAAAEMRERVMRALREADEGTPVDASQAHEMELRSRATAALAQDSALNWNLLANPSRLRMVTIDALAVGLTRQIPVTTGLGAPATFVDDAGAHYREAVRDALAEAGPDDPDWRIFLGHVENDAARAVALLAGMLARRDQWLRMPVGRGTGNLRSTLESALRHEVDAGIARVAALLPLPLVAALPQHQRYAAAALAEGAPGLAAALTGFADRGGLPDANADHLEAWRELANWLLVKGDAKWRVRLDKNVGFPAKGKGKGEGALERESAKREMDAWLLGAGEVPGLAAALDSTRGLPSPYYEDAAWTFVAATLALLPQLAARLALVFARRGEIDFAEATLRALAALGDAAEPGELLLAADHRFEHILIDEFQDTSASQIELLQRLSAGWEPDDGRTLFAVGDPMQSIYRFREAEVRFFLEAQEAGLINHVAVEGLRLTRNFRSQRPVIDWVNAVFPGVLAPVSDPERSEVAYEQVVATRSSPGDPAPSVEIAPDPEHEAALTVAHIRHALAEGSQEIAILVRARSHLAAILPALRRAGIAYGAVGLESLAQRLSTRDLLTMARALLQPDDRIAALALLRAPWCGLALSDLLAITQAVSEGPLLALLIHQPTPSGVSADGVARIDRLREILGPVLESRGRATLVQRLRAAWLALGGPVCAENESDNTGVARLLSLLERHERGGDVPEWDEFADAAAALYAESNDAIVAPVQVMTLHRAKGLEFDTVILPGLARPVSGGEDPPLRWKRRGRDVDNATLLLAPMQARSGADAVRDPVYRFLQSLDAEESAAELGRLLYVGCTRAKRRLHLIAALDVAGPEPGAPLAWANPPSASALARLWPAVGPGVAPPIPSDGRTSPAIIVAPPLLRLPLAWRCPAPPEALAFETGATEPAVLAPAFDWAQATAAAIGTVAHRMLAQIARDGLHAWPQARVITEHRRILTELAREGVSSDALAEASESVRDVLVGTLADPRGRWLFAVEHAEANSEWSLAGFDQGRIVRVTLDRSFVTPDARYIVDFKTARHEGADPEAFLAREVERYRPQLERYARIVSALDARPIRLGLYFPRLRDGWREWPANLDARTAGDSEMR